MAREPSLRERALLFLARREHTRDELERKLKSKAEDPALLDALLDELVRSGKLSDARFAEARTNTLARKFGTSRILHELKSKGVSAEAAQQAVEGARATEVERAREAWKKRFRAPATTREEKAKQMRFLQSRGFSFAAIRAAVDGAMDGAADELDEAQGTPDDDAG